MNMKRKRGGESAPRPKVCRLRSTSRPSTHIQVQRQHTDEEELMSAAENEESMSDGERSGQEDEEEKGRDVHEHSSSHVLKPPTGEELRKIKDATDLYRSSSFKLQVRTCSLCSVFKINMMLRPVARSTPSCRMSAQNITSPSHLTLSCSPSTRSSWISSLLLHNIRSMHPGLCPKRTSLFRTFDHYRPRRLIGRSRSKHPPKLSLRAAGRPRPR